MKKTELQKIIYESLSTYNELMKGEAFKIVNSEIKTHLIIQENEHLKSLISENTNILIIDIETTGFLHEGGNIVEVGIVELNPKTGERKIIYDKVVQEKSMIKSDMYAAWIFRNSDLTESEVLRAPYFEDEKQKIQEIINNYTAGATAYNNKFDFNFLENRGIFIPKKLPCPMVISTKICKLHKRSGGLKWPSVEEAWRFFFPNEKYIEKHRGADDAMHEAKIVFRLIELGVFY